MSDRLRQLDRNAAPVPSPDDARAEHDGAVAGMAGLSPAWTAFEARYELRPPPVVQMRREVCGAVERAGGRAVHISRLHEPGAVCPSPDRFLERAGAVARLDHPAIVRLCDFGHDAYGCFAITEATDAEPLSDLIAQSGPLDVETVAGLAVALCDALAAYHRHGLVHGGLCPASILINDAGDPQILDASLCVPVCDALDAADHRQPPQATFLAPECAGGAVADARSDVWGLGAVLHHLLTGACPETLRTDALPEPLRSIVLRALDPEPARRYASAAEMRATLDIEPTAPPHSQESDTAMPVRQEDVPQPRTVPSFGAWYDEKFRWTRAAGPVPSYVLQAVAWSALGFVWIPAWYLGTKRPS